jgi:hypothetical protein
VLPWLVRQAGEIDGRPAGGGAPRPAPRARGGGGGGRRARAGAPGDGLATAERPLPGGDFGESVPALIQRLAGALGIERATRMVRLYGTEATDVASEGGDVPAEVRQAVLKEGAVCLEDYWMRRSARAWFDADGGVGVLDAAADAMTTLLGWSVAERAAQIGRCRALRSLESAAITGRAPPATLEEEEKQGLSDG